MNRVQHYIKENKVTEFPQHLIFYDTETLSIKLPRHRIRHDLRLGVACYWRRADTHNKERLEYLNFTTREMFWRWVFDKVHPGWRIMIVAHNAPFDMGVVAGWRALEDEGYIPKKIILDFHCNIWKFRKDKCSLTFVDNMNWHATSLEALGDSIGIPKLKIPGPGDDLSLWFKYCRRDVDVLLRTWKVWYDFLDKYDLGSFGLTMASQSFNAYRHKFMRVPIAVHASNKAVCIERESYRGGRNECFSIGHFQHRNFYLLDVNSMYPYVMHRYAYPVNLVSTGKSLSISRLAEILRTHAVVACVFLNTVENVYGIKRNGKLLFPVGRFWATLTTQELDRALSRNELLFVADYCVYERAYIFKDFVEFFYAARKRFETAGNGAFAYLTKRMLNSLYGKFGQRSQDWEYVTDDPATDYAVWQEYHYQEHKTYTYRCINHRVERCVGLKEGFNSLVAIASEVTANARLTLHSLILEATRGHVWYVDTDSLIVDKKGYDLLRSHIDQDKLGALKLEKMTHDLVIHNLKDYSFGGKIKIKGISSKAEMISYNQFKQWQSRGIKSGLRDGDINVTIWQEITKTLTRRYNKGIVHRDGLVSPFTLSEPMNMRPYEISNFEP